MHLTVRDISLRDTICAAAREGIYIISLPRFIEAISQPNASEVISHLPAKANISPKRIPYGICDMPVGVICHFVTRYALRRVKEFISYRCRDIQFAMHN